MVRLNHLNQIAYNNPDTVLYEFEKGTDFRFLDCIKRYPTTIYYVNYTPKGNYIDVTFRPINLDKIFCPELPDTIAYVKLSNGYQVPVFENNWSMLCGGQFVIDGGIHYKIDKSTNTVTHEW